MSYRQKLLGIAIVQLVSGLTLLAAYVNASPAENTFDALHAKSTYGTQGPFGFMQAKPNPAPTSGIIGHCRGISPPRIEQEWRVLLIKIDKQTLEPLLIQGAKQAEDVWQNAKRSDVPVCVWRTI